MTQRFLLPLMAIALFAGPASADPEQPSERAEPAAAVKTIAVLDFRDLGPSVELEPLRRALARMLTTDLSAYGRIKLVARERVSRMIAETHLGESGLVGTDSAQRAGRALAADYLVQGTFAGSASEVKVQAEVFDVAAGQVVAMAEVRGQPEGLLAIEGKLVAAVAEALKLGAPKAAPAPQPRAKAVSLAVLYLQNLSPEAKLDLMEIGFADTLSTYLQDRKGIALVEREQLNRVLRELGLQQSALAESAPQPKLGQMLGAEVMLLGSFVVVKDAVRFDAHLVAADTGVMLQAVSAQGNANDLQPVLQTLADRVATALAAQPRSEPLPEQRGKTSLEAMLHYSRAVAVMFSDDRRALEELERCLYLDPENTSALFYLGLLYTQEIHDYAKGADAYLRLISLRPDYLTRCYGSLSRCYDMMGMPEQELAFLERAWEQLRTDESSRFYPDVIARLGRANQHLKRPQEAKRWFLLGIEKARTARDRVRLRDGLLHFLMGQRDVEGALEQLEAIAQEAPRDDPTFTLSDTLVLARLARRYQETKDYARAKRMFEPVARDSKIERDAAMAQYYLAKVAVSAGREADAVELLVQMADRFPLLSESRDALLEAAKLVESSLNQPQRAAQLYRRVSVRYGSLPSSPELRRKLGPPFEEHGPRPILTSLVRSRAWRAELLKSGRWVHTYSSWPWSRLPGPMIVAGYSVVMIDYTTESYFTGEEVRTLRGFVNAGGGLFLNVSNFLGPPLDWQSWAHLLSALGVRTSSDAPGISGTSAVVLNPKRNVLKLKEVPSLIEGRSFTVPQETVVATYQDRPVIAAFGCGLGRVVLSGLGRGLTDILHEDPRAPGKPVTTARANGAFIRAAVDWLQGREERNQLKDDFEAAQRKVAAGDLSGALADLRAIAARHPGTRWADEAVLLVAELLHSKGDLQAAAAEYQQLARSAKEPQVRTLARLNLARCRAAGGGPGVEQALAECWGIWREDQSSPWAPSALLEGGKWAYGAGDFTAAQSCFDEVMNTSGYGYEKLFAMLWSARCRETLGDSAGALRIYRTVTDEYHQTGLVPLPWADRDRFVSSYVASRIKALAP